MLENIPLLMSNEENIELTKEIGKEEICERDMGS
jgi:hypothetical protein